MKWRKIRAGAYVSDDGRYGVISDGYPAIQSVDADPAHGYEGFQGGEWAAVLMRNDETLNWFPTMREAREYAELRAKRGMDR